uniref:Transposable element Tc3 transposase n=1 Tax=Bactrocera latifrons TaxID=174628 RepID=A0A0K8U1B4_BACLA
MIWVGISYRGTTPICFISTKMDSDYYIQLLDDVLISFGENISVPEYIFQPDNAAIHRSRKTKEFLLSRGIPNLDWPAISPDNNGGTLSHRTFILSLHQFQSVWKKF